MSASQPDWAGWQGRYDRPGGALEQRLAIVQRLIGDVLDSRVGLTTLVVSICAGQGRDILGVLARRSDGATVRGRLVELDPANTAEASRRVEAAGLDGIEIVTGDAAAVDAYVGAVPADLVLACGIFGNIADHDVHRAVETLPQLCARGATVIWTRHRLEPDLTPTVRRWLDEAGFDEVAFEWTEADLPGTGGLPVQGVGAHRWRHDPCASAGAAALHVLRVAATVGRR